IWTYVVVILSVQQYSPPTNNTAKAFFNILFPYLPYSIQRLALITSDLIYDTGTGRLYATVPANAPQFANSLLRINPVNGEIESSFGIGSNPGKLARSFDGHFLYVALNGEAAIRQFDLTTQTPGIR